MRYEYTDDENHPDFDIVVEAHEVMSYWYVGDWDRVEDNEEARIRAIQFHLHFEDIKARGVSTERIQHATGSTLARLDADGAGAHARRIRRQAESILAEELAFLDLPLLVEADGSFTALCWNAAARGEDCPDAKALKPWLRHGGDINKDMIADREWQLAVAEAQYDWLKSEYANREELTEALAAVYMARCQLLIERKTQLRTGVRKGKVPVKRQAVLPGRVVKTAKMGWVTIDGERVRVPIFTEV
jgi:hypothetical protein